MQRSERAFAAGGSDGYGAWIDEAPPQPQQEAERLPELKRNAELEFMITPPSGITAIGCLPGGGVFILAHFQQDWICGTQYCCFRQRLPSAMQPFVHSYQQLLSGHSGAYAFMRHLLSACLYHQFDAAPSLPLFCVGAVSGFPGGVVPSGFWPLKPPEGGAPSGR